MSDLETTFYDKYESSGIVLNVDTDIHNSKLDLELENKTAFEYSYGEFQIEKLEEGRWIVVPFDMEKDKDDPLFIIKSNESRRETVFLEDYYKELDNGTYRIIYVLNKNIYGTRKTLFNVEFCTAEFKI